MQKLSATDYYGAIRGVGREPRRGVSNQPASTGKNDTMGSRLILMEVVKAEIVQCQRCDGMNIHDVTQASPGYGSPESPVVVVGQSLCGKPCMRAQIPFTGGSGRFLNLGLERAGLAKSDIFTTNVVHCHPPGNRPSLPHEIKNCRPYLLRELDIVQPRLVVGLGKDASAALRDVYPKADELPWPFASPRSPTAAGPKLLAVPHPSWIKWQPQEERQEYVESLAVALRWAFKEASRARLR
jgi:uracil-DNA glycosylase family 4